MRCYFQNIFDVVKFIAGNYVNIYFRSVLERVFFKSGFSNVDRVASWTFKCINNGVFVLFGSLSETKEPASVVCQLMMILHCDFRGVAILRIKLFVSLVPCFPMYDSEIQIFFKLGLLLTFTFSVLRLSVVVKGEHREIRFFVSQRG